MFLENDQNKTLSDCCSFFQKYYCIMHLYTSIILINNNIGWVENILFKSQKLIQFHNIIDIIRVD